MEKLVSVFNLNNPNNKQIIINLIQVIFLNYFFKLFIF